MREPRDAVVWDGGADRPGLQKSDSSPAERTGGMMGERGEEEEEQRRLTEIKGALIKGSSSFDRGGEGGGLQWEVNGG
ncbi:hypothetical protein CgunFtcFv8_018646 [Champsocephalus gunnari]|uniref:Uncharacterized protein n=1 Tax=Champsocephalus gunnari TaxID=52237 RepID=A0AAN8BWE8_CHAGU|nr:hypothetical protein CgunFtcFv8_018646 [Champsocephalus gunnari]